MALFLMTFFEGSCLYIEVSRHHSANACSLDRNCLDLDIGALGQLADRDTASCWLVGEPFFVLAVHFGKVFHVGQEDLEHSIAAR